MVPDKKHIEKQLTTDQACAYLGISRRSFFAFRKQGLIPAVKENDMLMKQYVLRFTEAGLDLARKNIVKMIAEKKQKQLAAAS